MTTADVLRAARALIFSPKDWCQENFHSTTGAHCAIGAILEATGGWNETVTNADAMLCEAVGMNHDLWSFAKYNDEHSHADVMTAFDRAIALAEAA